MDIDECWLFLDRLQHLAIGIVIGALIAAWLG